ncbi:MAG: Uncharacterized protein G01um101448_495 [Parcubacteria group bacterium Gr01-1014_48]|nr:MAG: Uncharacterized protein Greene041614_814 [Parcubacteria group bacterium Greene0416_14]TSC73852.1 MAG: Uncharacterized protein G01um101448_495 [Parcubacteria group bacterium Gr01-1014_48]TSD00405.1 MAG: Uncharacterized protein Greene101415_863 [Parcubacteria group bacterium Greene1014_15]TSD07530.1 MAG: Uncharacterized protein Greene07144_872 [Parcubacteria group bacterium Greene0714_4]
MFAQMWYANYNEEMEHSAIKWQAYEYEHREHGSDWYWAISIITIALFIAAILFQNILLGIILVLGVISIILHSIKIPPLVSFEINEAGIRINQRLYQWTALKSFSITENPTPKIYLQSKKKVVPLIIIPFEAEDYLYIRSYLLDFIEERPHEENLMERLLEVLGF